MALLEAFIQLGVTAQYSNFTQEVKDTGFSNEQRQETSLSNEQRQIFKIVNFIFVSSTIGLIGIMTNFINIVVFYNQGFKPTINVAFFALAVSDLCCLVTLQWFNICMNPLFESADLPFVPGEVQYLLGGWLHVCFSRITGWITVFITAERCLGIAVPLKVKQLINLRRTVVAMCLIFSLNLMALSPEYVDSYLDWKFYPELNRTLVGIVDRNRNDNGEDMVFIFTSASGIVSFVTILFLTIFLVCKLASKARWRRSVTAEKDVSTKDKKTIKMVALIATVLIVCYAPGTAISMVTIFEPEFHLMGKYMNIFFATWSFAFVFQTVNSSVNIFLYYNMSTKFRQTFDQLFSPCLAGDVCCILQQKLVCTK